MTAPVKPCTLAAWRLRHAKLTQQEAADRAGIPLSHASSIESAPDRATLGALSRYVQACGGKLECFVEIGGVKRLLVLLAMLVGCAAPDSDPAHIVIPQGWCHSHRCDAEALTYTPVGEGISDILKPALERWGAATGRDLGIDPQAGIPVMWRAGLSGELKANGKADCARTVSKGFMGPSESRMWAQYIELDRHPGGGCPAPAVSLLHELEHAMAPLAEHVEVDSIFAASTGPVMRPIDEPALERLCTFFDCWSFSPEL